MLNTCLYTVLSEQFCQYSMFFNVFDNFYAPFVLHPFWLKGDKRAWDRPTNTQNCLESPINFSENSWAKVISCICRVQVAEGFLVDVKYTVIWNTSITWSMECILRSMFKWVHMNSTNFVLNSLGLTMLHKENVSLFHNRCVL